ncbi:MAG: discoidin domain-containing protein, partial [Planctomycetota bacterium]
PGWTIGNALVLIFTDDPTNPSAGLRTANTGPLLHIEWSIGQAKGPSPADGAIDVSRDVVLSWRPGIYAAPTNGHKVYFSENFNDVNDGIGSITQDTNSYDPGRLDFNKTYYWRVDEVNGPPDYGVYEGNVWSFTTELLAYPVENITATASTAEAGVGPEKTIDGSGLDDNDLHSNEEADMWLSSAEPLGAWIEYEFDKVYKLHQMWVWNYNQAVESILGFGFKDVTIEYSTNGTDYTTLGTTVEFARAPGTAGYAHDITIDFGSAVAKYVRLTATSNWGGMLPQYGLSEVRFFYIPVNATEPYPDSGATGVDVDVVLGWKAGREAVTHDLYFSTDEQTVIDGTAPVVTVAETSYGPLALDLETTHYWRVDEVNEAETPTTWESNIWSFTVADHIVVDDFESYNDLDPSDPKSNRIFNTWLDGLDQPTNGSLVGYENAPFCEQTIVHGGMQSMPFFYSNTGGAAYSEAELPLSPAQNWTEASVQTLALHFNGTVGNTGQLYVKINGSKVTYDGDATNLTRSWWHPWNIDLASVGTNLQNVTSLSIGIDENGASGTLLFDDIGLYALAPAPTAPVNEWRIAASSDDAEEYVLGGGMELSSSDLELGYEDAMAPGNLQTIGCRWVALPIPKGATITEAWVQFSADEVGGSLHMHDVSLIIEGELSPNPATFSETAGDISSRPTTTAQVVWDIPQWMTTHAMGPEERTADISSIVQEIVNQDGWAGNAIVLIFRDNPAKPSQGARVAEALDGTASEAPLLHISYQ